METNFAMLMGMVEQGALALWALVVLLAVREIKALRNDVTKSVDKYLKDKET